MGTVEYFTDDVEAGIFTWCLATDTLFADSAVAALFGLDPYLTVRGLPIADYLAWVHPEDRPPLARRISEAVIDGGPYSAAYRVVDPAGQVRQVMSFGRCFRDKTGNPAHYAGIVHPYDGD